MNTKRRYKNPPIIEAICEFHFEEGPKWNSTYFGLFHERIKKDFPKTEEFKGYQLGWEVSPETVGQRVQKMGTRMRFCREDGTALVQLSENFLAVNLLLKYPGWTSFAPLILSQLSEYVSVIQPKTIIRIGLRYINRIELLASEFEFRRFFQESPYLPRQAYEVDNPFFCRFELGLNKESRLILNVASRLEEPKDGNSAVIVDLDHVSLKAIAPRDGGEVAEAIQDAHNRIAEVFESMVGEELRSRFGVET